MDLASFGHLFTFFIIIVPLAIIHEYFHGYVANLLGDPTAKYAGRLTLNPLAHMDIWGTVILPITLSLASGGSFVFAYAKPVPVNPLYLRGRYSWALVAAAGPAANFLTAGVFGLLLRLLPWSNFSSILAVIVFYSILLGVFNLLPIPPLDGSKIIFPFFPPSWLPARIFLEQFGFVFLLMFLLMGFSWLSPILFWLFRLFTGLSF